VIDDAEVTSSEPRALERRHDLLATAFSKPRPEQLD